MGDRGRDRPPDQKVTRKAVAKNSDKKDKKSRTKKVVGRAGPAREAEGGLAKPKADRAGS
ncbi:hypothetical protein Val02_89380 [Virgisporangium aliadipatigenens]|uniref:Uncharacterized protein n=1 Tax=Virgisporangium aliadipatigenens TaxID=741659 RepID=A0A8J3YWM8_9ACTN|nr:hypothetical protein Val02_89380 [Virgisporangium aliadipatigenens]